MFFKFENLNSGCTRGPRLRAGGRTPWFHTMIPFKACYDSSWATHRSYFELHVYPDAGRGLLVGYMDGKQGRFTVFRGQMDISPQEAGCANWEEFLNRWSGVPSEATKE